MRLDDRLRHLPHFQTSVRIFSEGTPVRFRVMTVGVALLTLAACSTRTPESAPEQRSPVQAEAVAASPRDWPMQYEAAGIVRARLNAPMSSQLLATVMAVHVRVGDRVTTGTPLVTLDTRELTANQTRATAGTVAAQETAASAAADEVAANASLTLARLTHDRIAGLATRQSATPQELDQAVAALAAAEAQLRSVQARRAAAEASRRAALAESAAADTRVSYARLTAPFDGVVTARAVDPGVTATPGTPLLVIEDVSHQRLEVSLDEARAAEIRPGHAVEVALQTDSTDPQRWLPATVSEVQQLDASSHTFIVKIELPAGVSSRSGSVGRARFSHASRSALTVPDSAVVRRGQLAFVFAVDNGSVARLRAISIGDAVNGHTEVLAGLSAGDRIVSRPAPGLLDGQPLQTSATAAPGDRP